MVLEKESSEFKLALHLIKINLVLYPARGGWAG